ncbi:MAG: glycosyltransferase [Anaerolineales bacterium]|nr:glycosyltransferase [Anaerolineales bacterium]
MSSELFCTTIIPTVGRTSLVRAVQSVLTQDFDQNHHDLIVVNDSGAPLPDAPWQHADAVQVLTTQHRERCVARNTAAAMARGRYLHFLDDDDWLLPGALTNLAALAAKSPEADWLYGWTQLVDREGNPIIELRHTATGDFFLQAMAGEWIPLQSSVIKASAFFEAGCFNPNIPGAEDVDLLRKCTLRGGIAGTPVLVAAIGMGVVNSSTDYDLHPVYSRQARELILDDTRAYRQMLGAAKTPAWHGRMARIYFTSAMWNLKRSRVLHALGRGGRGVAGALAGGAGILSGDFWRAVKAPYDSETFLEDSAALGRQWRDDRLKVTGPRPVVDRLPVQHPSWAGWCLNVWPQRGHDASAGNWGSWVYWRGNDANVGSRRAQCRWA